MNTCPNCKKVVGLHFSTLPGCMCQYTMTQELFRNHTLKLNNIELLQKREWIGMTDDELESMAEQYVTDCYFDTLKYGQAIQSKLKELNI